MYCVLIKNLCLGYAITSLNVLNSNVLNFSNCSIDYLQGYASKMSAIREFTILSFSQQMFNFMMQTEMIISASANHIRGK